MSSMLGTALRVSIFGESHAPAIGCSIDGMPAGVRSILTSSRTSGPARPGRDATATTRREADRARILCGVVDGHTTGAPIAAIIENENTRSQDYDELRRVPRPGHADYPARIRYNGFNDVAGGGHFSGSSPHRFVSPAASRSRLSRSEESESRPTSPTWALRAYPTPRSTIWSLMRTSSPV